MPLRSDQHPLRLRHAALVAEGRALRGALARDLHDLSNVALQRARLRDQLLDFGRRFALRGAVGLVQNLMLPRWIRLARLLLRGWRLWRRLRAP